MKKKKRKKARPNLFRAGVHGASLQWTTYNKSLMLYRKVNMIIRAGVYLDRNR